MKRKTLAAIVLSLLSPFFAEILSGSTPPLEAINPITFLSLWGFYGSGVLLFHELWVRKNPTAGGIMLFGFSYGILEEGIFVKSWFDPHWVDLGVLGTYGRVMGVNAVWAVWLTIFHAFMSIWVPIMVFELIFPDMKREKLLNKKSAVFLISVYLFIGILMLFFLTHYIPPFIPWLLTLLLALLFAYLGCHFRFPPLRRNWPAKHPFIFGLIYLISLFILFVMVPYTTIPFFVPISIGIPLAVYFYWSMDSMSPRDLHLLMLGSLSFWLLFMDFIFELNGLLGQFAFGLGTYILLVYLFRKRYRGGGNFKREK